MELPPNWILRTIGDVCLQPQYGWTTKASPTGRIRLLRTTDITSGSVNWKTVPFCSEEPSNPEKYLLQDGDIVISRAGSVGFSQLIKNPAESVFASYLIRFRPLSKVINEKYLSYFLQSPLYWQAISENSLGIAIPNVNASKLRSINIPIAPLSEQERIVARIEELFSRLDAGVAALKRAQAALKRYRASVLKAACEGRLVPQDPNDEPAGELLRRMGAGRAGVEGMPELPVGWEWAKLGELATRERYSITDGPFGSNLKTEHYTDNGPRVIRLQNIGEGIFRDEKVHISYEHFQTLKRHQILEGDLVIAALGESLPRSCIIPGFVGDAIVKADCIRFKAEKSITSSEFLNIALNSDVLKKIALKVMHGIGRPRLNQQEVKLLCCKDRGESQTWIL